MRRILLCGCIALAACATPARLYGHLDYELSTLQPFQPSTARASAQHGPLVIGAFEDLTVAPIGGNYSDTEGGLLRTYHYWALLPKLTDELQTALSAAGLRTFKSAFDLGQVAPFPAGRYPPLVVLRGEVRRFQVNRHTSGDDVVLGELALRLIAGADGEELWKRTLSLSLKTPSSSDPFAIAARQATAQLLADAGFVQALARRAR